MIKKTLATAAIAASVVGAGGMATPALAIDIEGDEPGATSLAEDGSSPAYGNTTTGGYMSPDMSLIDGSLNKTCVPVPAVGDVISGTSSHECSENTSSAHGDAPLADALSDATLLTRESLPVL